MKRFLAVLAVVAVAGVVYVAAAPGSQTVTGPWTPQLNALKKEVGVLNRKVKGLKTQLSALKSDEAKVKTTATNADGFINSCLIAGGAVPINEYGDTTNTPPTEGYQYTLPNSGGDILTTALDLDPSATPGAFVQAVDSSCITSTALHTADAPTERRAALHPVARH